MWDMLSLCRCCGTGLLKKTNFFSGEGGRDRGGERCVFIVAVTVMLLCLLWVRWWSSLENLLPCIPPWGGGGGGGGVIVLHIGHW